MLDVFVMFLFLKKNYIVPSFYRDKVTGTYPTVRCTVRYVTLTGYCTLCKEAGQADLVPDSEIETIHYEPIKTCHNTS